LIQNIEPAQRGFVGETFIINSVEGKSFFAKIVANTNTTNILPALFEIHQIGFEYAIYPIKTLKGKFFIPYNDRFLIVFNFIEEKSAENVSAKDYARLVIQLHGLKGKLTTPLEAESFSATYQDSFWDIWEKIKALRIQSKEFQTMKTELSDSEERIKRYWDFYHATAKTCQGLSLEFVPTHGDIPINVLRDKQGRHHLVDWDGFKMAPRERDLWNSAEKSTVIEEYLKEFPDFQINQAVCRYYTLFRYFDDLWGFLDAILKTNEGSDIAGYSDQIIETCFRELDARISKFIR